ncbi:alpha/beta fold hydrolase [Catenulispora sp. NF23]|uniref:alpha/beta fold hydrolase n=1 Tax=Catenulispora pinistramenti TaxID=2705254 RepID=UPI001BA704EA|nr:alpha/beta fold hydrolase [Catenulispora pinistramenti]MBS2539657.1 alpha/beta fold hydrolase [Catenulispora pinistramenti]
MTAILRAPAVTGAALLSTVLALTAVAAPAIAAAPGTPGTSATTTATTIPATASAASAASAATTPATPLAWGTCPAPTPNANGVPFPRDPREQCASLRVPRDYRDPGQGTITLEISRIRTADPAHRRGDLVVVPGGPGGSGLDYPGQMVSILPSAVLSAYDLIGFDERGVGNSTPVRCDLPAADRAAELNYPFPAPDGSITANLAYAHTVADDCAAASGPYLADITTANSARDLDRIRAALGDPAISYVGTSYGTYLGEVYASLFPTRTDHVVLDSSVAPGGVKQGISLFSQGAAETFPALAAYLAARDSTLHLGATPAAVRATYFRLTAELDRSPLTLADGRVLTGNALRAATYSSLTNPAYYSIAAVAWQLAATRTTTVPGGGSGTTLPTVIPDNFVAAQDAVICQDSAWPSNPAYYVAHTAADRQRYPLTDGMSGNVWPCAFWHYRPTDPPVRPSPAGPRDILMLQNRYDPDTAYSGARQTLHAFGHRAEMVTVDASGHGVNFSDPRVSSPLIAFLLSNRLPG